MDNTPMTPAEQERADSQCPKCGEPLVDGGVDWYCDTVGCEDELTLANAMKLAARIGSAPQQHQALRDAEQERAAIVKWLRERAESVFKDGNPLWEAGAHNNLHLAANAIERGDYIKQGG